jgi:hypothetical protein
MTLLARLLLKMILFSLPDVKMGMCLSLISLPILSIGKKELCMDTIISTSYMIQFQTAYGVMGTYLKDGQWEGAWTWIGAGTINRPQDLIGFLPQLKKQQIDKNRNLLGSFI